MPHYLFRSCFDSAYVGHNRGAKGTNEGYDMTWYDVDDDDGTMKEYSI